MESEEFEEGISPTPRRSWDWLQRMKPGQSRIVEVSGRSKITFAIWYWGRKSGRKFALRKEKEGYRIYCLR